MLVHVTPCISSLCPALCFDALRSFSAYEEFRGFWHDILTERKEFKCEVTDAKALMEGQMEARVLGKGCVEGRNERKKL